jgi:amino acid transporter
MDSQNPVLFSFAAVIVACMGMLGLGVLFVRAENIERRNLVGLVTLFTSGIAAYVLYYAWNERAGASPGLPISMIMLSLFGFIAGRVIDAILGPRSPDAIEKDPATYGADLAV